MGQELEWKLVYTKLHCEAWAAAQLRNQGFSVLLPRARGRGGDVLVPLFPRYVFVGHEQSRDISPISNTRGVRCLVQFASQPARVAPEVIEEVRSRMDAHGVVHLEGPPAATALFDRRQQERLRALVRLAQAGFRVVA